MNKLRRSKLITCFKQAVQDQEYLSNDKQKFLRQDRITIEKQKELYQKQVDS